MWSSFSNQSHSLEPDHVHIWSVSKSNHIDRLQQYWEILNQEERLRAGKFRFSKDQNCFVIARGVLRILLGKYLSIDPVKIQFKRGHNGKPYVDYEINIQFNVSHSRNMIVLGFVLEHNIGVDIEYALREVEIIKIANLFFAKEEVTALMALEKDYHTQAFYNCWTRKEAFIKAEGSGLAFPLDQFVVSLDSKEEATLIDTKWDKKEKEKWVLDTLEPEENYIGAVSVKGNVSEIQTWQYR